MIIKIQLNNNKEIIQNFSNNWHCIIRFKDYNNTPYLYLNIINSFDLLLEHETIINFLNKLNNVKNNIINVQIYDANNKCIFNTNKLSVTYDYSEFEYNPSDNYYKQFSKGLLFVIRFLNNYDGANIL